MSVEKSVESVHKGGVTWLDLDGIEHRWLLAAAADASVAAYDIQVRITCPLHLRTVATLWLGWQPASGVLQIAQDMTYRIR